jgi:hypothetical protein
MSFDEAVTKLRKVADDAHICLRGAVSAPTDETTFAVIEADSAEAVIAACWQAGWQTDRVTPVTRANLT